MSSIVPNTSASSFETGQFKISAQDKSFGQKLPMRLSQAQPETASQTVAEGGVKIGRRYVVEYLLEVFCC